VPKEIVLRFNEKLESSFSTVVVRDGLAHVQAGAGIVHDSDPESEFKETLHKASAVVQAIRAAHRAHGELGSIEASIAEENP